MTKLFFIAVSDGTCVSKIVNGKLVQVGECKKNDESEIARLIKKSLDEKKKAGSKCDFKYDSKCFRLVVYDAWNVTFNDAESICKLMYNGKPANIYDLTHYLILLSHMRPLIPTGQTYTYIWTGMEYKNNQLLLSSGRNITLATEVWYPGLLHPDASSTNVAVIVYKYSENTLDRGLYNGPPSSATNGVICEI
uniref:uncharacterized protein LOC120332263 n=1 Tax=Styela clava TaxID=7725 RepID=UPI00193AD72E|nr:uncharacterized protein LOC120332263 [Styela clava]